MKKIFFLAAAAAVATLSSCGGNSPSANLKTDVDTISYEIGLANTEGIENYFMQMGIDSTMVDEFLRGLKDGAMSGDDKKKSAYMAGVQAGQQIVNQMLPMMEQRLFAGDSTAHLSLKNYLAGFMASVKGKSSFELNGEKVDPRAAGEDVNKRMMKLAETYMEKQYGEQKQAAEKFIEEKAKEEGVQTLEGGTLYRVITAGNGEKPKADATVQVEYEGKLVDGTVFDGTAKRNNGKPVDMPVSNVIEGMKAALQAMPVGSEWELYIPYGQGYGAQGAGRDIPPFSALIFRVKLVGIK